MNSVTLLFVKVKADSTAAPNVNIKEIVRLHRSIAENVFRNEFLINFDLHERSEMKQHFLIAKWYSNA